MDKIIVGISGASGTQYGLKALEILKQCDVETHLVISKSALQVMKHEASQITPQDLEKFADIVHPVSNIGATIASGSFKTKGMLITPCSIKTLSEIATGVTSSLLTRAADVVLKERRRLVLMVRETPFHLGHLRSMTAVTEMGGIIMPPVPSLYTQPKSVDEIVHHSVVRALDLFGFDFDMPRWQG